MNILVTGGAGYIGSILVPKLLQLGYQVTVIDNFLFDQNSLADACYYNNFTVIKADVRNIQVISKYLKNADLIIPLAALVGAPICTQDPVGASTINRGAIIDLLSVMSADQKLIMPTTNSAYGSGNENNYCDENSELFPISQYAIEKVEVERAIMSRSNSISLRLATVFGMSPRMRTDLLVNDFVYKALNDRSLVLFEKQFKRNFIHVRDAAKALIHAIENIDLMSGEIYNVGLSSANISKQELAEAIKKYIPELQIFDAEFAKDPDQRNYIVSNAKIEATGFKTSFTLDDGIQELIKGYKMISNNKYTNI